MAIRFETLTTVPDMLEAINRDKPKKLYIQVLEILKARIESNEWPVGVQIPVEEGLCKIYGVSKATIRLAVLELVRQGYLIRRQGRGTFVCKKTPPPGVTMSTDFDEFMIEVPIPFTTRVLAQTVMTPVDDLEVKLEAPGEKHVIYIRRLLLAEDEPVLLAESYVPHRLCPDLLREELSGFLLTEILEKKFDIPITKIKIFVDVANLTENEGMLLGLAKGAPALLLEQHFYSAETQVMYMRTIKRADRFRFSREFEKK